MIVLIDSVRTELGLSSDSERNFSSELSPLGTPHGVGESKELPFCAFNTARASALRFTVPVLGINRVLINLTRSYRFIYLPYTVLYRWAITFKSFPSQATSMFKQTLSVPWRQSIFTSNCSQQLTFPLMDFWGPWPSMVRLIPATSLLVQTTLVSFDKSILPSLTTVPTTLLSIADPTQLPAPSWLMPTPETSSLFHGRLSRRSVWSMCVSIYNTTMLALYLC